MYKHIISLGEDCFMRSMIDRYSFRNRFPVRMPFDGASHPYDSVCKLIETGFLKYTHNIRYNPANHYFYNDEYDIAWNHEKTSDIPSFIEQCQKRVTQFETTLTESSSVLFLVHKYGNIERHIGEKLKAIIENKYPALSFHILILYHTSPELILEKQEKVTFVSMPWDMTRDWVSEMYITEYGIQYSTRVMELICDILGESADRYVMDKAYHFDHALV